MSVSIAVKNLIDQLGVIGSTRHENEEVVKVFRTSHRTLQQVFVRLVIIPILLHLAEQYEKGQCDGRNMSAGRLASLMVKNLTDDDLYLPFV